MKLKFLFYLFKNIYLLTILEMQTDWVKKTTREAKKKLKKYSKTYCLKAKKPAKYLESNHKRKEIIKLLLKLIQTH